MCSIHGVPFEESDDGGMSVQYLLDLRDAITLLEGIDSPEALQRRRSLLD